MNIATEDSMLCSFDLLAIGLAMLWVGYGVASGQLL
jgi:hypothetical protein